jgi:hypothetical protein
MTITKVALFTLFLVFAVLPCHAAAPTPEQIIDAFFGPNDVPDRAVAYTGEMKRLYSDKPTLGQRLAPGSRYTARRLALSPDDAPVYGVAIHNGDETFDWYAYFALDDGILKLGTVRTLGLSGMPYELMQALARKATRSEPEEWDYQNLRIAFLPDIERLAHFRRQLGELEALKAAIDAKDSDTIPARLRTLHFRGWEHNEHGQVEIRIGGGLLNSVVGVLYVPPGENPPAINEQDHIYIEQIEGPWYVYKTT